MKEEILRSFKGRNVLITGGTGMLGRQVVDILSQADAHIRIVSLDRIRVNEKAEHIYGDLTEFSFCRQVSKDMEYVFHLAGVQGSVRNSRARVATHLVPTLMMNVNMLEACRINGVSKTVITGSVGAYPEAEVLREADYRYDTIPMDFAGWGKRMAELQIHAYKAQHNLENFSVVVPSHVYGPGDNFDPDTAMVIPALMYKIRNRDDPVMVWGDGNAARDFVFSRDVAEGAILALYYGTKGEPVNLGSGVAVTIRQLVETLHSFLDFNHRFDINKPSGYPLRVMDVSLARGMLGYNPSTSLSEGLRMTWEWFMKNEEEYLKKKNYFLEK